MPRPNSHSNQHPNQRPRSNSGASLEYTAKFDNLYKLLNEQQKNAVDSIEGPVMVIAGPGTGKTTLLTLRIANIIRRTDCAPENILALTFTESAAGAMKRKLADIIGAPAFKVNIHTFHGFAEHIISAYPDYFSRIIGSSIVKDIDQFHIIENILSAKEIELLRPYGDPLYYVKPILREIHILKRENISPKVFLASIKSDKSHEEDDISEAESAKREKQRTKNLELAFVYQQYEAVLEKRKLYDFDDMLLELIKAMDEYDELKLMLQETYQYILADEHQDANASQNKILELLADFHDEPNLFIVGDEKQAIYRFQGASLENFLYFKDKYAHARIIDLVHNYRSHQIILDAAHSLIEKNPSIPGRQRTKLSSLQVGGRPIRVIELSDIAQEYAYITGAIQDITARKSESLSEIAVLYRDNSHAKGMSRALLMAGIPHRIESDVDVLSHDTVLKIDTLLRAINDPSDDEKLGTVLLFAEFSCDPGEVRDLFNIARRSRVPLYRVINQSNNSTSSVGAIYTVGATVKSAYEKISAWSKKSAETQFTDFLDFIMRDSGMHASIISSPDAVDRLSALDSFYKRVREMAGSKKAFYLRDYVAYMDIMQDHGILSRKKYVDQSPGVRLMTAHRSKGLEFNHVFIIHARDGVWGNRTSRSLFNIPVTAHARDNGNIDDERRLFYVALTRARENVTITYTLQDGDKESSPSQFLFEIEPQFVKKEKVSIPILNHGPNSNLGQNSRNKKETSLSPRLLDREFVARIFRDQALSVTHLNNFISCPWKYFFTNLIRIPQMEEKHQLYGTAIHATMKSYFDLYKDNRDLDTKKVVELFAHELDKLPFDVNDKADALKKGKLALTNYIKSYYPSWPRNLITEYGVTVLLDIPSEVDKGRNVPPLKLTGKLDKVNVVGNDIVHVVDYKTGKPKSRNEIEGKTKNSDGNYMRQLAFYKLLLDTDGKFSMKSGEIDFIEPNDRGIHKKESFEVTNEQVESVVGQIRKMYDSVTSMSFLGRTCDDDSCEYCRLAKLITAPGEENRL